MMDEKILLYSLLFTSIFNLLVLLVLAIAVVRLGAVMAKFASRVNEFLEKGEKEVNSVGAVLRGTLSKSDQYFNTGVRLAERYMLYRTFNRITPSQGGSSKLMTVFGVGFGLFNVLSQLNRKKRS